MEEETGKEEVVETKKVSKKTVIIITVIVVLLLIAGFTAWYIISNMDKNKPDEVLNAYIECLKNQDYEGMYLLLSDSTKERVDKETFLSCLLYTSPSPRDA